MIAKGDVVAAPPIRLLLADVDGTLVTQEKVLTDRSIAAVRGLREADILFAVTSGRPPRGMSMLVQPLDLQTPIAAFNGGLTVDREMDVLEQRLLAAELVPEIVQALESAALDVWIYRGADWYVCDAEGSHVAHEARTVGFAPTVLASFEGIGEGVAKLVGVSDDFDAVRAATDLVHGGFGERVSVSRSQLYYVDVTHPEANKGEVVKSLSARYEIPTEQIATIGDGPNDTLMFAQAGLSIAMGNSDSEVQRAAQRVTATNDEDGFATAVERLIVEQR
jgi:Cof subfamily protein (haloacid dehalogenase superfamily)